MAETLILIVEDNPRNLKLIRDVLQFYGYETLVAETGELGVELARQRQPALILMDVQLPGMDGAAAARLLKADPDTQHIPIIAMTAFAMKGDRERLLDDGFDDYVSKPIRIKEVPDIIKSHLKSSS
jgi:two-component system cell cycle response regulator DivK